MPSPHVLKFGGAALADGPAILRACAIVREHGGSRPIVVVSAALGVTDLLEAAAAAAARGGCELERIRLRHRTLVRQLGLDPELLDRHLGELTRLLEQVRRSGRLAPSERDFALSFGERMSARIVARALRRTGVAATPVDAFDLGFTTDSNHGSARLEEGALAAIRAATEEVPGVAVVTGFLAKDRRGNLTTLGRNGSDLTASIIAEAVGAAEIQFWKAVGGVMTADPALVEDAAVIERLSFAEAAELAFHGASVLHPAAVAPALRACARVRFCDVRDPRSPGTRLERSVPRQGPVGIAARRGVVRVDLDVETPERRARRLVELFATLEAFGVAPGLVVSSADRASAIVPDTPALERVASRLGDGVRLTRGLASLALVGPGTALDAGLERLRAAGVAVRAAFLGERELSQAFLVAEGDLRAAARALHGAVAVSPRTVP